MATGSPIDRATGWSTSAEPAVIGTPSDTVPTTNLPSVPSLEVPRSELASADSTTAADRLPTEGPFAAAPSAAATRGAAAMDGPGRELAVRGGDDVAVAAGGETFAVADPPITGAEQVLSRNAPAAGFPTHRTPSARSGRRAMPGIASPADAAARSAAARGAAANSAVAPSNRNRRNEPSGIVSPRQEAAEAGSALTLFFEPEPAVPLAEPVWPAQVTRVQYGHRGDTPMPTVAPKRLKDPRSPAVGLVALVIFAFVATFFAWFSAGPLWLSLGHAHQGTATVAECPVAGINKRCAEFVANDDAFTARVTLLGPSSEQAHQGATIPAEMVSSSATMAYAGDPSSLYLRWVPGLAIVLLCGFGIAWSTGGFRLIGRKARGVVLLASIGGPILIAAGMLAITW